MSEAILQRKIQASILKKYGGKVIKVHGNEFTEVGTPDLIGGFVLNDCHYAYVIEVKLPGHEPTPIQKRRINEWRNAGFIAGWCTSPHEAFMIIEEAIEWS